MLSRILHIIFLPGDHKTAAKRVAELEGVLKTQNADFKKKLDQAEQREIDRLQAEKTEVVRLLSLADHLGRKSITSFCILVKSVFR